MIKTILLIFAICTASILFSQTIGANGEGLTEKYLPADISLIQDLGHIAIAVPGGASAKNTYARLNVPGYGMRLDSINAWFAKYKADENGEGLEKEIKDYEQDKIAPRSYLYDLADIQNQTGCELIWKVNVFSSPSDVVFTILDFLSLAGTSISYFELGNELYFIDLNGDGKKQDGPEYVALCIPYINALRSTFPDIPIAMNYAQDITNKAHGLFNDAVENYILTNPGKVKAVGPHPYLSTSNVLLPAAELHPSYIPGSREEITPLDYSSAYNAQLNAAFNEYNRIWSTTGYYQSLIDTIKSALPGIEVITTEWQSNPILLWGDTESNGAYLFYTFTTYRPDIKYFLAHNLLGGYTFAWVYNHGTSVKYYAAKLANELPLEFSDIAYNQGINIEQSGTYYYRYINTSNDFYSVDINLPAGATYEVTNKFVWGLYNYSSMGGAGFYNKKKGSPIQGVDAFYTESEDLEVKGNSFGFIKITVTIPDPIVYGCTDPGALNYNPEAEKEFTPSNCEYEDIYCFKKRFFSKGCKLDPKCKKNNCTPKGRLAR